MRSLLHQASDTEDWSHDRQQLQLDHVVYNETNLQHQMLKSTEQAASHSDFGDDVVYPK